MGRNTKDRKGGRMKGMREEGGGNGGDEADEVKRKRKKRKDKR